MKNRWFVVGAAAIIILFGAAGAAARSYNPLKWIKKNPGPTANEQLAAHPEEERKLTLQLQALLPPKNKPLPLDKAIHVLNSDVDARDQAKSAERRAREDIKDASS